MLLNASLRYVFMWSGLLLTITFSTGCKLESDGSENAVPPPSNLEEADEQQVEEDDQANDELTEDEITDKILESKLEFNWNDAEDKFLCSALNSIDNGLTIGSH